MPGSARTRDVERTIRRGVEFLFSYKMERGAYPSPYGDSDGLAKILRGLPNGASAIFPTLGGDLLSKGPPCLSDLRRHFLLDPSAHLDTAGCVQSQPRIEFAPPAK